MALFSFIGIGVTGATIILYGEAIWDPVAVVSKFSNPLVVFISMFALMIATLSTNIAANVVGPANDFSNVYPEKITFKCGAFITGVIGILMMPWKLIADPTGYIFTWLIGYSALLGPIAGIMLVDYFLLRKTRLVVDDLYRMDGIYAYSSGVNWIAVATLILGVLPSLPGFLVQINLLAPAAVSSFWTGIYQYAWFAGLTVSGTLYFILMKLSPVRLGVQTES
jgi:NCS1 family nucleobase:cation symporter-1